MRLWLKSRITGLEALLSSLVLRVFHLANRPDAKETRRGEMKHPTGNEFALYVAMRLVRYLNHVLKQKAKPQLLLVGIRAAYQV